VPAGRSGGLRGAVAAAPAFGGPGPSPDQSDEPDQFAYAPTYYPGVTSVAEARPVSLGLSQELLDVGFSIQLVRAARVAGQLTNPDGTPATAGSVNLAPEGAGNARIGPNLGARIQANGAFSIANVPPGRYVLLARNRDRETPQYAFQPITVSGQDLDGLTIILAPGATITGTVRFQPGQTPPPDPTQVRITAPSTEQGWFGSQPTARVERDGRFSLPGVAAGSHLIRTNSNLRGWTLRSVTVAGRDVTDVPMIVRSGEQVSNVEIVFTDRLTEISGTITTNQGSPVPDFTVLAFPTDRSFWHPQARHILTARPDQTGKYRIRGLPPGDYYLAAVDPAEQGEWFEPAYLDQRRAGAAHLTLGDGEVKTQDFRVNLR
jgi:Carboxypeptidase regulatory-like domain